MRLPALSFLIFFLAGCSTKGTGTEDLRPGGTPRSDSSGFCEGICEASPPSVPVLNDTGGFGDVTTYGSVAEPAPSQGGACNYGSTEILRFAAIQVSMLPGDMRGQWRGEITLSAGRGYVAVLKGADLAAEKSSLVLGILP